MYTLVLGSTNIGKLKDYQALLSPYAINLVPQTELAVPEVAETGLSFVENALIKARHAAQFSNLPALGDDSGLVVESLGGTPGLHSARYAGTDATAEDNMQKLLHTLAQDPKASRKAHFYSVIVLLRHPYDPAPLICEGTWEGEILKAPCGKNGFGYLPIFYSSHHQCPAAELTLQDRNRVSHRAQAFQQLFDKYLKQYA